MTQVRKATKRRTTKPRHEEVRTEDRGAWESQVRLRAYSIFLARGGAPGHDIEDWLQAERDLQHERG